MYFKILCFFILIVAALYGAITIFIKYAIPIFSKVEKEEKQIYNKWIEMWKYDNK